LIFFALLRSLASARRRRMALSFWHQKETKNAG
jgi:hypothetical protein